MMQETSLRRCCLFTSKLSSAKSKREEYLFRNRKETSVTEKTAQIADKGRTGFGGVVKNARFYFKCKRVSE